MKFRVSRSRFCYNSSIAILPAPLGSTTTFIIIIISYTSHCCAQALAQIWKACGVITTWSHCGSETLQIPCYRYTDISTTFYHRKASLPSQLCPKAIY